MKPASDISEFGSDLGSAAAVATVDQSDAIRSRWMDIYELTKPRMNFLVLATTMVGFYMAARGRADWVRLPAALVGTAFCAAGASILNQFVERRYDALMPRTANRPLPTRRIAPTEALIYGIVSSIVGTLCLLKFVNPLTALLGAITVGSYVLIYTPLKRYTTLNTIIGAVPGALPPVMGWTAASGVLSSDAVALFAILFVWQIPHFLAIAILYRDDYRAGGFKMLPVEDRNLTSTSRHILMYAAALIPVSVAPAILGMAGVLYFIAAVLLGSGFLSFAMSCATTRTRLDARRLFFASIIYLPVLLAMLMLNRM